MYCMVQCTAYGYDGFAAPYDGFAAPWGSYHACKLVERDLQGMHIG